MSQTIHTTCWGNTGPRVVLVHGGTQGTPAAGHANFRSQETLGGQGFQLVIPDRPGHGASPAPDRPDDAEQDGIWVADMLGDGAHLVGHSFGALVALAAASRRPEAVKSLVLIEPALLKIAAGKPAVRKVLLQMAAAIILPYSSANKARKIMTLLGIPGEFAKDDTVLANVGSSLKKAKLPSKSQMIASLQSIRAAGIPMLVVSGGSNAAFVETGEMAVEIGGGKHITCPAPHHFPQWNDMVFNPMVSKFWMSVEDRARSAGT